MPLNIDSVSDVLLSQQIKALEKSLLATLNKCRDEVDAGRAATQLNRWFGDSDLAFSRSVKAKIAKMKMQLNCTNIPCQRGLNLDALNNAEATHLPDGMTGGGGVSTLDAVHIMQAHGRIDIGPNFKNLPQLATSGLDTFADQDQFQTIAHELSHAVLGTKDENNSDGRTAYGGDRARQLVQEDKAKAKTNAENWGFFIEEFYTAGSK